MKAISFLHAVFQNSFSVWTFCLGDCLFFWMVAIWRWYLRWASVYSMCSCHYECKSSLFQTIQGIIQLPAKSKIRTLKSKEIQLCNFNWIYFYTQQRLFWKIPKKILIPLNLILDKHFDTNYTSYKGLGVIHLDYRAICWVVDLAYQDLTKDLTKVRLFRPSDSLAV